MVQAEFNIETGKSCLGPAAVEEQIEQDSYNIVPLYQAFLAENLPENAPYPPLDTRSWDRDDCVVAAKWIMNVLEDAPPEVPRHLSRILLQRVYDLGMGASPYTYDARKLPLHVLANEIGAQTDYSPRGLFDKWTIRDFVSHGEKVSAACGGKRPREGDYARYAEAHANSPTLKILVKHMGTISHLNEQLGFPDTRSWNEDDFIRYGARLIAANGIDTVQQYPGIAIILSLRDRGASYATICRRYGSWQSFIESSNKKYLQTQALANRTDEQKTEIYRRKLKEYDLPYAFRYLDDKNLLRHADRHILAEFLLPNASDRNVYNLSCLSDDNFMSKLLELVFQASERKLIHYAKELGVLKDWWAKDPDMQFLKVEVSELTELLSKHAAKNRAAKRKRHAGNLAVGDVDIVA